MTVLRSFLGKYNVYEIIQIYQFNTVKYCVKIINNENEHQIIHLQRIHNVRSWHRFSVSGSYSTISFSSQLHSVNVHYKNSYSTKSINHIAVF